MTIHKVLVNEKPYKIRVLERDGDAFLVEVNGKTVKVKIKNSRQGETVLMDMDGKSLQAEVDRIERSVVQVKIGGKTFEVQPQPKIPKKTGVKPEPSTTVKKKAIRSSATEKGVVTAPIAGRIALLKASARQKVEKGECICVLEAMKMENEITTPKAGIIQEIRVSEGSIVNEGDILAVII